MRGNLPLLPVKSRFRVVLMVLKCHDVFAWGGVLCQWKSFYEILVAVPSVFAAGGQEVFSVMVVEMRYLDAWLHFCPPNYNASLSVFEREEIRVSDRNSRSATQGTDDRRQQVNGRRSCSRQMLA